MPKLDHKSLRLLQRKPPEHIGLVREQIDRVNPYQYHSKCMTKCPQHLGGSNTKTNMDKNTFLYLVDNYKIKSMLDLGSGPGGMVKFARNNNIESDGIDGDPTLSFDGLIKHDFITGVPKLSRTYDLVWSVEFVEHVEEQFLDNILDTIRIADPYIIFMTAACPGQRGHHHVNLKPESYWVNKIEQIGYRYDKVITEEIRMKSSLRFTKRNGMFFVKFNQQINLYRPLYLIR